MANRFNTVDYRDVSQFNARFGSKQGDKTQGYCTTQKRKIEGKGANRQQEKNWYLELLHRNGSS